VVVVVAKGITGIPGMGIGTAMDFRLPMGGLGILSTARPLEFLLSLALSLSFSFSFLGFSEGDSEKSTLIPGTIKLSTRKRRNKKTVISKRESKSKKSSGTEKRTQENK